MNEWAFSIPELEDMPKNHSGNIKENSLFNDELSWEAGSVQHQISSSSGSWIIESWRKNVISDT